MGEHVKTTAYFFAMSIAFAAVAIVLHMQLLRQASEISELRSELKEARAEVTQVERASHDFNREWKMRLDTHRDHIADLQRAIRPRTGAGAIGTAPGEAGN